MERIKALLAQWRQQWTAMSTAKKAGLGGGLGLGLVLILGLFMLNSRDGMEYLFVNVSTEDAQAIVAHLKKSGLTEYIVDDKGVRVPSEQVLSLRVQLAEEGLPAHGMVGWEKFDSQDFAMTEFEQNVHRLRAVQGELGRTIMALDGIVSARVHIVTPRQSVFVEDQKDATAAVYIKTKRGVILSQRQVGGMVHLVSRAVEGLKPEHVTIIDNEGKMLTKIESNDPSARMTAEMFAYKRNLEEELESRARAIVARVVGPDRVEAKVDVDVDFTQIEQTISDVDPDRVVPISTNRTTQSLSGKGMNPTGIPGAKSNVPGEAEPTAAGSASTASSRDSEVMNFEPTKTISKKTFPVGGIKRITAAVLVDGKQAYPTDGSQPEFEARTEEEMAKIQNLVKSAIGFKEGRDELQVQNMMFQLDPLQVEGIAEKKKENRQYIATLAVSSVVAMALVFFFAFIVRPYFRWLSYDPERKKEEALVEEFRPDLELGGLQNVQVKEDVPFDKLTPQEQVLYLAKHEPARTTEALRILLNPHQVSV